MSTQLEGDAFERELYEAAVEAGFGDDVYECSWGTCWHTGHDEGEPLTGWSNYPCKLHGPDGHELAEVKDIHDVRRVLRALIAANQAHKAEFERMLAVDTHDGVAREFVTIRVVGRAVTHVVTINATDGVVTDEFDGSRPFIRAVLQAALDVVSK